MGSRNPAIQVTRNPGDWSLEPGCWSLETGKWSFEVRNWNMEAGSCILETPVLFGRSRPGPRFGALVDLARGTSGPNILIDKRAGLPAGQESAFGDSSNQKSNEKQTIYNVHENIGNPL